MSVINQKLLLIEKKVLQNPEIEFSLLFSLFSSEISFSFCLSWSSLPVWKKIKHSLSVFRLDSQDSLWEEVLSVIGSQESGAWLWTCTTSGNQSYLNSRLWISDTSRWILITSWSSLLKTPEFQSVEVEEKSFSTTKCSLNPNFIICYQ